MLPQSGPRRDDVREEWPGAWRCEPPSRGQLGHRGVVLGRSGAPSGTAGWAGPLLAQGTVTLVNRFDLELVVLAGHGFAHAGERYVSAVRRELASRSFARANHDVEVRLSPIADDVGAVGAASMVLHSQFAPQMLDLRSRLVITPGG